MCPADERFTNACTPASTHEVAKEIFVLGMSLLQAGKTRAAAFQFGKALAAAPDFPDASLSLGHCLHELGEYEQALAVYGHLLAARPLLPSGWNNRGTSLLALCRYEEAAVAYARVLDLAPGLHDARVALATCYQALGRIEEASALCDAVLIDAPRHAEAHWNKSLLLLLKGEYRLGWQEYEWRWQKRRFTSPQRVFPQNRWRGEPAVEKSILIHAEQGFGDTLQFCRYIPLVANRGMRIIFECHPPLADLMQTLACNVEVVPFGQPLPQFDLHVPLLSLPLIFGTTVATIPDSTPYLATPKGRLPAWHLLVPEDKRLRVGLCWAGKSYPDPLRSCPANLLAPLAEVAGVTWYSLQFGANEMPCLPMVDLTGRINDFGDTAALISRLDLVITIDTAVAHLAGAMGKPVWLMLPHAPDWRWLLERDDSPWYPTMRLFRQKRCESWKDVTWSVARLLGNRVDNLQIR